jgi:6-phosphogluconolactonase
MNFLTYKDRSTLAAGVADAVALALRAAIAADGRATLCVAGGTTPAPMFDVLAQVDLDWSKVTVLPTDERWVDGADPRSNAALVKKHLMVGKAAAAKYVGMFVAGKTPDQAVGSITAAITPHLPITALIAGMGADLHTASLFPDADGIVGAMADDAPPVMVMQPKSQPEARITLTAPVLRASAEAHIMISGTEKRIALDNIGAATGAKAPVSCLLGHAQVHWAE